MKRVVKSVSFNLDDPHERKIYEEATKDGLFSKNVKRLLTLAFVPGKIVQNDEGDVDEEIDFDSFAFED